nr:cytochrome c oxidase subunit II [Venus verrucosa]
MLFKLSFWNQFGFPDPATEMAGRLYIYHDLAMVVLVMVLLVVGWFLFVMLLGGVFFDGSKNRYVYRNELLETFWTVVPALFLIVLGYVSLKNLYDMEVGDYVGHTVKVTGHQWYWEYYYEVNFSKEICKGEHVNNVSNSLSLLSLEYLNGLLNIKLFSSLGNLLDDLGLDFFKMIEVTPEDEVTVDDFMDLFYGKVSEFIVSDADESGVGNIMGSVAELFLKGDWFLKYDSYLVPETEMVDVESKEFGVFRNQAVGSSCLLACGKKNEVLVLTADVMHSWGVPELGVKADAVPGRCNSLSVEPVLSGIMFGNCYELCGEGHSQMPINVIVMDYSDVVSKVKEEIFGSEGVEDFFVVF